MQRPGPGDRGKPRRRATLAADGLEPRMLLAANAAATQLLTPNDVTALIRRAEAASSGNDAIIAVVDRAGDILGVRVEGGVSTAIKSNPEKLTFAIDGALAEARTAALFANNQAPLTSRTIQLISQTTMLQREIQSDPNVPDPNSPERGPGFVAPVGIKGHFPPGISFTPQVDLFAIEHTNRDSLLHPDRDGVKHAGQNILPYRFNIDPSTVPPGQEIRPPESYGYASGLLPTAQSRGIGTLPGGIPLFKNGQLVGGIGVFFPGMTGYATEENSKLNGAGFYDPAKRDRSMEAEFMAFAAAGGVPSQGIKFGPKQLPGAPLLAGFGLPFGRIDLVGITLDLYGGHGLQGLNNLLRFGRTLTPGPPDRPGDVDEPVDRAGQTALPGQGVPDGWLVAPHDGGGLTAADVESMIARGIAEANRVRAAIRLPLDSTAKMVFAVGDKDGNILGLYRMPDATVFSIDVAVAKARNVAYYANAALLQPQDRISNLPAGVAFTNRTVRYAALPYFPEGININPPGPFSVRNDPGSNPDGSNAGAPVPASAFQSVQGYDAFHPGTNFHDPDNLLNQNGVIFFPGSAPLYKDTTGGGTRTLVGGLGVSGDGVDQDDDVTFEAATGFEPPSGVLRADEVFVRGVRLPYIKFNRQPHEPIGQAKLPPQTFKNLPLPPPRRRSPHAKGGP